MREVFSAVGWVGAVVALSLGCQGSPDQGKAASGGATVRPSAAGAASGGPGAAPGAAPRAPWTPRPRSFVQVDRCTVRVEPRSPAELEEMFAYARQVLAGMTVVELYPTRDGDRISKMIVADAPPPPHAPTSDSDVAVLAGEALVRYSALFGHLAGALAVVKLHGLRTHEGQWQAEGSVTDNGGYAPVRVELEESGALRWILVRDTPPYPPPGAICSAPRVALDDPRIRAAVVGQTVTFSDYSGKRRKVTFTARSVGPVGTRVIQIDDNVFRRVITVRMGGLMSWTAFLDADTAALLRFQQDFVT